MYDSFYNLAEKPFQISTDPKFLWRGEKHREALANLQYGLLNHNGFVVLTGDVGTGKTTLINALLETLDDRVLTAKINHPSLEVVEFFYLLAKSFDPSITTTNKSDLLLFFNSFLHQADEQGKIILLIVDEAHRLSIEMLEEIRLLSNIEAAGKRLLNIIFVGQNELKPILSLPQCRALRQRVTLFYEIQALTCEETHAYVAHRLKVSGLQGTLFTPMALQKIHSQTQGNPRLINILSDRALLTGFIKERKEIGDDIIDECSRELGLKRRGKVSALAGRSVAVSRMFRSLSWRNRPAFGTPPARDVAGPVSTTKRFFTSSCRFLKKYRFRIITSAAAAGIAFAFLSLTIGAYRSAGLKKDRVPAGNVSRSGDRFFSPTMKQQPMTDNNAEPGNQNTAGLALPSRDTTLKTFAENPPGEQVPASPHLVSPNPSSPAAEDPGTLELATAAVAQKKYEKAVELLETYQSTRSGLNSKSSEELYSRALVGRAGELEISAPKKAETLLRKAIEVNPMATNAFIQLGKYYTRSQAYDRAVEFYQEAVRLDPNSADAYFNLGFAYAAIGNYEDSENAFTHVVQLKPSYLVKSLFNLAVVQQKLGKAAEALANLETAAAMEPENHKVQSYLENLKESSMTGHTEQR